MRIPLLLALFLLVAAASPGADLSLLHVRRAQKLLGPEVWSEVIRVENTARRSHYPRTVHALVFELAGLLWFYTDTDGTQSFSLHRGRLAEEKADYAPLLRDIEPGFVRWSVVVDGAENFEEQAPGAALPNGCFIESYAALRRLVAVGATVAEPRLLSYYGKSAQERQGHTVLAYSVPGHVVVIDPLRPDVKRDFPATLAADPKGLARALEGPVVAAARVLPLPLPLAPAGSERIAFHEAARSPLLAD